MFGLSTVKLALIGGLVLLAISAVAGIYHFGAEAERAKITLAQERLIAADDARQAKQTIDALLASQQETLAIAARATTLKEGIHAAPSSRSCLASPAGRAFVVGLRAASGDAGSSATAPAKPVGVSAAAHASR